ncbi:hypothetical protein BC937DRAFT_90345 [Endogone sp. FLAS-F59071]|nr:hypothetical protein BC937DRAFT_90345 [Endogone sp. FLAS-F59071]|eukprot:RUS23226.1 hypothetical protein BC937DRAFT_90345 [Endogone sp. FLAS-F59071]
MSGSRQLCRLPRFFGTPHSRFQYHPRTFVSSRVSHFSVGGASNEKAKSRREKDNTEEQTSKTPDILEPLATDRALSEQEKSAILAYKLLPKRRSSLKSPKRASIIPQDHIPTVSRSLLFEVEQEATCSNSSSLSPVSQAIDHFRPLNKPSLKSSTLGYTILPRAAALRLRRDLGTGFTHPQLKTYLKELNMVLSVPVPVGGKKEALIERVVRTIWGVRTKEELEREEGRKNTVKLAREEIPSSRRDLFFIIGQDGTTLRRLESGTSVKIKIDIEHETYTIEGRVEAVKNAKQRLAALLATHFESTFDITPYRERLGFEAVDERLSLVHEIAKMSGAYIIPAETDTEASVINKLSISGQTERCMSEANRLLELALAEPDIAAISSPLAKYYTFLKSESDPARNKTSILLEQEARDEASILLEQEAHDESSVLLEQARDESPILLEQEARDESSLLPRDESSLSLEQEARDESSALLEQARDESSILLGQEAHDESSILLEQEARDESSLLPGQARDESSLSLEQEARDESSVLLEQAHDELSVSLEQEARDKPSILFEKEVGPQATRAGANPASYAFSPVHDALAMPLLVRHMGWSRLGEVLVLDESELNRSRFTITDALIPLGSESTATSNIVKDYASLKGLFETDLMLNPGSPSSFGHLLFHRPPPPSPSGSSMDSAAALGILYPPLEGRFDRDELQRWWEGSGKGMTRWFFDSQPSHTHPHPFLPVSQGTINTRTVHLEYIRSSLLRSTSVLALEKGFPYDGSPFARLNLSFEVTEEGKLNVCEVFGERRRCVVDVAGMEGNADMRIIGKLVDGLGQVNEEGAMMVHEPVRELVERCELLSHTELDCPGQYHLPDTSSEESLILCGVTFRTTKRYDILSPAGTSVLSVSQLEEQDGRARRCEVVLHPKQQLAPGAADSGAGMGSWDGFIASAMEMLNRWRGYY